MTSAERLLDQHQPHPMQHEHTLLLATLGLDKAHSQVTASQITSASAMSFFCRFT
jgi:hypothetical protein